MGSGMLYVVAGPIGNLKDITLRALEILKSVDLILSEDTRETDKILKLYDIQTPQISYRDQNHAFVIKRITDELASRKKLALLSDSGTPLISDPGFKLVEEVMKRGFQVSAVPGPSAVVSALSVCGLPTDKFVFLGFLPKKTNQRHEVLSTYGALDATLTIYESPYRVRGLLDDIHKTLGDRTVCIVKDLTKMYEFVLKAKISDILKNPDVIKEKGEYTILVAKKGY